MNLNEITQEEADLLNQQTEAELQKDVAEYERQKTQAVSNALDHLLGVVKSETIEVKFSCSSSEAKLKIKANPSQKVMQDLVRISKAVEQGKQNIEEDEDRLCRIMEDLTVEPVIPFELWKSGEIPEEISARIIIELIKHKATRQEEMEEDIKSFRKDRRRSKTTGNCRDT